MNQIDARPNKHYRPQNFRPAHRGHVDVSVDRGYPPEYDAWPEIDQVNYENGRLTAANMKLAFGDVPRISTTSEEDFADWQRFNAEAIGLVGKCRPVSRRKSA